MKFESIIKYELGNIRKVFPRGSFNGSKILIVGGGFQQYHAIKESIYLGFEVFVSDQRKSCPGASLVNDLWNLSCLDHQSLLKKSQSESIDFAFTMQSDLPVPAVAYINNTIRDESSHYKASINCCRKDLFRQSLQNSGCHQPDFLVKHNSLLTKEDEYNIIDMLGKYKSIVIKPSDSSGSRGVQFFQQYNKESFEYSIRTAMNYSQSGAILIEGFIAGIEFGAQTMSYNGYCVKVFIHSDVMNSSGRVPLAHSYPHPEFSPEQIQKFQSEIARAVNAIGIQYGPTNVDCILGNDGKLYIIEIGARIGATCLPELTSLYSGVDWINLSLGVSAAKYISGFSIDEFFSNISPINCYGEILATNRSLTFNGISCSLPSDIASYLKVFEIHATPGDVLNPLTNGTDNYGRAIFSSSTKSQAELLEYSTLFHSSLKLL